MPATTPAGPRTWTTGWPSIWPAAAPAHRGHHPGRHRLPPGPHLAGGHPGPGAAAETPGWGQPPLPDLPGRPQGPRSPPPASPRPAGSPPRPREPITQRSGRWAAAVPTPGTRPDRVQAFLELNPRFARPARASQAKQWGGARSREGRAPRPTGHQRRLGRERPALPAPGRHRTRRAVQARLQPASNAPPTGPNRPAPASWPPVPTSGCSPANPQAAGGRRPQRTREERDRER